MISIHIEFEEDRVHYGWLSPFGDDADLWLPGQETKEFDRLDNVSDAISNYVWSASTFKNGYRNRKNFLAARYLGLDFDGNVDLKQALEWFKDFACVIATTRNHRKVKKKDSEPRDRFRVIVRLSEEINDIDTYYATAEHYISLYNSDKACKDPARFFFPSPIVVYVGKETGRRLTVRAPKPKPIYERPKVSLTHNDNWGNAVAELLFRRGGFDEGNRHEVLKKAAYSLAFNNAYSADQIYEFIRPNTSITDDAEVRRIAESAFDKARGNLR